MKKLKDLIIEADDFFYQSLWIFTATDLLNDQFKYDKLEVITDKTVKQVAVKNNYSSN